MEQSSLQKQVVLACILTGEYDVNRNTILPDDDFELVKDWAFSIKKADLQGILFHNCFSEETQKRFNNDQLLFIKMESNSDFSPNVYRYFLYLEFLEKYQSQITDIFLTDVSDVVMLTNPFNQKLYIENCDSLFCGDEPKQLDNEWMQEHSTHFRSQIKDFADYEQEFAEDTLLNCGIIGGRAVLIVELLKKLCFVHANYNVSSNTAFTGDMGAFNYVMRKQFDSRFMHGFPINTVFKEYQTERADCWFRHK